MRCASPLCLLFLPAVLLAQSSTPSDVSVSDATLARAASRLPAAPEPQETSAGEQAIQPGERLTLTVEQAVAMAQANSPRLKEAAAGLQHATAAARTARAYSNPSVEVYEGEQYARPIATPGVPGLLQHYAVTQLIEIPQERRARRQVAEYGITGSHANEQAVGLSVVADVKHAFYTALQRRAAVALARENLTLVQDLHRRVEVQVQVGERGRLELTRAEAELARARYAVRSAEIELANAIASLRARVAAPASAVLDPQGQLEPGILLPPLDQLRATVMRTHPAVALSQAEIHSAEAELAHQRALRIPAPSAFAEFENQPDIRFWRVGVTLPLPLWDRRQGQIGEAKAAISQSNSVLQQRQLELVAALERAYEQYQLADQQADALEAGPLHSAESAVQAAQAAYRFGERGIVEVLDAQRVLQGTRSDLLDAQYARQSALIDLEELGAVAPGARP